MHMIRLRKIIAPHIFVIASNVVSILNAYSVGQRHSLSLSFLPLTLIQHS